jgi:hypothetical protein
MGFLTRWFGRFGRKRAPSAAATADWARGGQLAGRETGQSSEEQAATRGRMEAEMDAQRQRRQPPPTGTAGG